MTLKLAATIPLALAIAACGGEIDGSDTADLGSDVTEVQTGPEDAPEYEPGEDGLLQSDIEPVGEPIADEETMADDPVDPAYPAE